MDALGQVGVAVPLALRDESNNMFHSTNRNTAHKKVIILKADIFFALLIEMITSLGFNVFRAQAPAQTVHALSIISIRKASTH